MGWMLAIGATTANGGRIVTHRRTFSCWAIIRPAEDIPGEWVAHCLDFDVVSQGRSPEHALDMIQEATAMTICDDLNGDRDPMVRRAPGEDWALLYEVVRKGTRFDTIGDASSAASGLAGQSSMIAVQFLIELQERTAEVPATQIPFFLLPSSELRAIV
jgi:predicted RNase H-like HicB family nuclease